MPPVTEAESRVMDVLWRRSPQSADEVVRALEPATHWHEKTIKTLLNRLLRKGAIAAQRDGRRYLYSPLLDREQWQAEESQSLLDRVFGGRLTPLLAHFSKQERLGAEEIAELRRLLDRIERGERKP
jgi:predicted transcriptional regulator